MKSVKTRRHGGGGDVWKGEYRYGFSEVPKYEFRSGRGLDRKLVERISSIKGEPSWMRERRLEAFSIYESKPMPKWGADLGELNLERIHYYTRPEWDGEERWDRMPKGIKRTYERLGLPEAERKYLAGVKFQYESEVVYGRLMRELEQMGVVFLGMDEGLKRHPELVKKYFGTIVPSADNKFAALNTAVWSGGSFVYVPKGVKVDMPIQAYFRLNSAESGQFERTLIVVEEGASVHYVEGCSAPRYTGKSLHSAVVEVVVGKGASVQYTTIQNWYRNVYNLVTKRMRVGESGRGVWVDCNLGSKVTMKYPSCYLVGRGAHGEVMSLAVAGRGQIQDTGAKMIHAAPDTSSVVTSKSVSLKKGAATYRGLVKIYKGAVGSRARVVCDALILDRESKSFTFPTNRIEEVESVVEHEAKVSKIGEEQLFYVMSRGLSAHEAGAMIVDGFLEPVVKTLPMEYAVELNRLVEMEMEGSVG